MNNQMKHILNNNWETRKHRNMKTYSEKQPEQKKPIPEHKSVFCWNKFLKTNWTNSMIKCNSLAAFKKCYDKTTLELDSMIYWL